MSDRPNRPHLHATRPLDRTVNTARRAFLKLMATAGVGALAFAAAREYARRVAPWQLGVERVEMRSPRIPRELDGVTIGHISDLHVGRVIEPAFIQRAVGLLNSLRPDLVAITGDLKHDAGSDESIRRVLAEIRAPLGSFVTFGNHDHWTDPRPLRAALEDHHTLLLNTSKTLRIRGVPLHIVGIDDVWEGAHDLDRALAGVSADQPALLLAHEPDYADEAAARFPFIGQLSGHTHGGQIRLPFIGAPALPPFGRKYVMGSYAINGMNLYVTRGVGMALPPYRFLCPPEVTLVTLRADDGRQTTYDRRPSRSL
jgi:hypothetical protein